MTDALLARALDIIGQQVSKDNVSFTLHEARSLQGPCLVPVRLSEAGIAFCCRLTMLVDGIEVIHPEDWCIIMAHEIADMNNAQLATYLRDRLAVFANGA